MANRIPDHAWLQSTSSPIEWLINFIDWCLLARETNVTFGHDCRAVTPRAWVWFANNWIPVWCRTPAFHSSIDADLAKRLTLVVPSSRVLTRLWSFFTSHPMDESDCRADEYHLSLTSFPVLVYKQKEPDSSPPFDTVTLSDCWLVSRLSSFSANPFLPFSIIWLPVDRDQFQNHLKSSGSLSDYFVLLIISLNILVKSLFRLKTSLALRFLTNTPNGCHTQPLHWHLSSSFGDQSVTDF